MSGRTGGVTVGETTPISSLDFSLPPRLLSGMAFDTSSGMALDNLRASQNASPTVEADTAGSIDEDVADLVSQFHEKSKGEEADSKKQIDSHLDEFKQSGVDRDKLDAAIQKHQAAKLRNQFISDYRASSDTSESERQGAGIAPGSESN